MYEETTNLKFTFNKKYYEQDFYPPSSEFETPYVWKTEDTRFVNFMNKVIRDNNLKGQFYFLDQGRLSIEPKLRERDYLKGYTDIIYLTPQQYNYLRTNKLLPFNEESPEGKE